MKRGRKGKLAISDKHEAYRYREAGVPLNVIASMLGVSKTTLCAALREMTKRLGKPPELPDHKKHLARQQCFTSGKLPDSNTSR
jgi:hypothetical protein